MPCLLLSTLTGIFTGALIFLFKAAASFVISSSETIYEYARANPKAVPFLLIGAAVLGFLAAILLRKVPDARGGGIPTAIATLRGLIPFNWVKSIVFVFISSMITYFGGIPLGNEGPSVQMGTAVGRGTVSLFAKKHPAWDRYIMTGGACAGFAAATGSPITGILFAIEEAHLRISPMIFMSAAMTVISGAATTQALCELTERQFSMFHFHLDAVLPLKYIWAALIIGLIAGFSAAGYTKLYHSIRHFVKNTLKPLPSGVKIAAIFAVSACAGLVSASCIGSGHDLIDELLEGHHVTWLLVAVFLVRAVLLLVANNADITGGLFVPTLAFGAITGAVCGKCMIIAGILPEEFYPVTVVIGIASYLGASSRIPLIALAFSVEALSGLENLIPIAAAVTISYLVIETLGITDFTDTVIESKTETVNHGKELHTIEADITVAPDAFACGKAVRDLFLPPTCMILSIRREKDMRLPTSVIAPGDVLYVHYRTFDPEETFKQLEGVFGQQEKADFYENTFG